MRQGQPAPCVSDAICGGGFTSCRHRQDLQHSAQALSDRATRTNLGRLGHTPNFSHARVMIHKECIERSCLRRGSLRVKHRRVAFRAVTLEKKKEKEKWKQIRKLEEFIAGVIGVGRACGS